MAIAGNRADAQHSPGVLRIFISYRRKDAPSYARELYQALSAHFKDSQIFWDIKLELGIDFVKEIERAVGSCDVLVAVIGPNWLRATDERGQRRLEDPKDFVRLEIATALDRNIRVIPVLVQGASMPAAEDLPAPLQSLSYRSGLELSEKHWEYDVGELIASLERVPHQKLVPPTGREPFPAEDPAPVDTAVAPSNLPRREEAVPVVSNGTTSSVPPPSPRVARPAAGSLDSRLIIGGLGVLVVALAFVLFAYGKPWGWGGTPETTTTPVAAASTAPPAPAPPAAAATANAPARPTPAAPTPTAALVNYADELTDFGVAPLFILQSEDNVATPTPTSIPGGTVVVTSQLASALKQAASQFVLIDALGGSAHATIPGAESVPDAGSSGSFNDSIQQSLEDKYSDLTDDLDTPMVFFCQGSRCWESYNASLRAIHMGYTHVYWYRGGLCAWMAAGLPLTNGTRTTC